MINHTLAGVLVAGLFATGSVGFAANVFIPQTEVFATGVVSSFVTDRDWLPTDTLHIRATGITCTLAGCEVTLNAAGIIAHNLFDPSTVGTLDGLVFPYAEGAYEGALILGIIPFLDGDRPWIQLFRPTPENGLGMDPVPSTVESVRMLGDYGGFLAAGIPAGTTLYLATADFNHSDNSGSYLFATVPEPSSLALVAMAAALVGLGVRRRVVLRD